MTKRMTILAAGLVAVVALALWACGARHPLVAYLASINLVSAGLVGMDKALAKAERWRVPERVLLGTALAGGSPLAWCAMQLFRHKTVKASYRAKFFAIALLQSALIGAWAYWKLSS